MNIESILRTLAPKFVLTVGCNDWRLARACESVGARLIGSDSGDRPNGIPQDAEFYPMVGAYIYPLDKSLGTELVVVDQVLERSSDPIALGAHLARHTKAGGCVWIEAQSELSAQMPAGQTPADQRFTNFWDDPTNLRPWTPAALYRLALSVRLFPLAFDRSDADGVPVVQMLAIKPFDGDLWSGMTRHVSLKGVEPGAREAFKHVWGCEPEVPAGTNSGICKAASV